MLTFYVIVIHTPGGNIVKLKKIPQLGLLSGRERSFVIALRGVNASLTAIVNLSAQLLSCCLM